ncbi:acetylornithine transaminase [Knoellia locipacati]|uniref:acetylornithine transaminase n=1 Tax=Knoellia locipacati TaxID=882824 RepID=UPI00384C9E3F
MNTPRSSPTPNVGPAPLRSSNTSRGPRTSTPSGTGSQPELLDRYAHSLIPVFGTPQLVLERGAGPWVWDTDGKRYLDLVGGIAVNALGHNHPALVAAVSKQIGEMAHISNFYTSRVQIELAERLLAIAGAPEGSGVFFANSGAEAVEGAIKLSRRTGRTGIVAAEGAFHGRTTGALALTHKAAYREPFAPLIPDVTHVPNNDIDALRGAVTTDTAAVVLEPVQGEAGAVVADPAYLRAAREVTTAAGALLVIDEVQTGIGRTGDWFGFQESGIVPDAITLAKGLGGGLPIGALVTFGAHVTGLLTAGQHGSTFSGNPLVAAAGLSVLSTIESEQLLGHVTAMGEHLVAAVAALEHPDIVGVRGRGLLRAIVLRSDLSADIAAAAREAGFLVNAVAPDAIRLVPPLVVTAEELDLFVAALPSLIATAKESNS